MTRISAAVLCGAVCAAVSRPAHAQPAPFAPVIYYHGFMTNLRGEPMTASFVVRFSLFDGLQGEQAFWTQSTSVEVVNGNFAAPLGGEAGNPLPAERFTSGAVFIGLNIAGEDVGPRQRVGASPLSLMAIDSMKLGGYALAVSACAAGQALTFNGSAWVCAPPGNTYSAGNGLQQDELVFKLQSCSSNQVLRWNGSGWQCGDMATLDTDQTFAGKKTFNHLSLRLRNDGSTFSTTLNAGTTLEDRSIALPDANGTLVTTGNLTAITGAGTIRSGTWQGDPVAPAFGGTGLAGYAVGDLLYASGAATLSKLADVVAGNALVSGGVGVAPSWGKVGLETHVSGTLPVSSGGTGATTLTANGVLLGNGASPISATGAPSSGQILVGNAFSVPAFASMLGDATLGVTGALTLATVATAGTSTKVTYNAKGLVTSGTSATLASADFANQGTTTGVLHGNAAGDPSWAAVSLTTDVSGVLPNANGGTNQSTYATGDLLYASAANTLSKRAIGSGGQLLTVSGGVPTWSGTITPNTAETTGLVIRGNASQTANLQEWQNSSGASMATLEKDGTLDLKGNIMKNPVLGMLFHHASFQGVTWQQTGTAGKAQYDGFIKLSSGTAAGSVIYVQNQNVNFTTGGLDRTGAFLTVRMRYFNTIDAAWTSYVVAGGSGAGGTSLFDAFGFKAVGTTLYGVTRNNSLESTLDVFTTLVAPLWVDLLAVRRASAIEYFVNGVSKGTISTNLPNNADSAYELYLTNGSSTTNADYQIAHLTVGIPMF